MSGCNIIPFPNVLYNIVERATGTVYGPYRATESDRHIMTAQWGEKYEIRPHECDDPTDNGMCTHITSEESDMTETDAGKHVKVNDDGTVTVPTTPDHKVAYLIMAEVSTDGTCSVQAFTPGSIPAVIEVQLLAAIESLCDARREEMALPILESALAGLRERVNDTRGGCRTYWGSHGCKLPRGHSGACECDCCECESHPDDSPDGVMCVGKPPYYGSETNFYGEDAARIASLGYGWKIERW